MPIKEIFKCFSPSLLMVLMCFGTCISQTNEGQTFWFGFMEHVDKYNNTKVAMITSKTNATGLISIPNSTWSQSFNVQANEVTVINLPLEAEFVGSEFVDDNGVLINSQQPVSVYIHQFSQWRSEATVVLPIESISNEYYALSYRAVRNQGTNYPSEFLIIATEDETVVSITVADNTKNGLGAGSNFSVNLDRGQTYQVQSSSSDGDMSGSHIIADKKIAVFAGNSWTEVPTGCAARDNLLEQMYPVSTWGKQFISVPNKDVSFDVYRVLASENNTTVNVEGDVTEVYTLNEGEFVEYNRSDATFISSSKPIQVAQFNAGFQCTGNSIGDPSMMLLNSIEQTRDTVTLFNSSFQNINDNFINVVMYTVDIPFVTLDGTPISNLTSVETMDANPQFSFARIEVSAGAHTLISEGCGVIANAYGYGDAESYSYSGGASFAQININPIPEGGCLNDTIFFDTGLKAPRHSFDWDLGDGSTSNDSKFQHFYPNLGSYPVRLILTDHCLEKVDTFYRDLVISLRQEVDALDNIEVCEGEAIHLEATDLAGANYEWSGPLDYFSEEQFPALSNSTPDQSGDYLVIGIISGCATFPATTEVIVHPTPLPALGNDSIFCSFEEPLILDAGTYSSYTWQDGSSSSTIEADSEGQYTVNIIDEFGCEGSNSINILERCPTKVYLPNIFSPNRDGINDEFCAQANDIVTMDFNIFDRWGNLVFHSKLPEDCWDGKINGKDAPPGVYAWIIQFTGFNDLGLPLSEIRSGDVTIIR